MIFYGFFLSLLAAFIFPSLTNREPSILQDELALEDELLEISLESVAMPMVDGLIWSDEQDIILEAYQDPVDRDWIELFFEGLTGSRDIAVAILANAAEFNIPPSLAFSLCWEESRYNPRAVNRANSNKTVDRGLFQLNSASFPDLKEQDFFDPNTNARHGLSYLRWCLNTAGTEIAGLAMYNAGSNKVRTGGTPKRTLDYISRIINRQRKIDELFLSDYSPQPEIVETPEIIAEVPAGFTLSLLTPLGRF